MKISSYYILGVAILAILIIGGILIINGKKSAYNVVIETSQGKIVIELYSDKSPITVRNFLEYVRNKDFDGTVFHRVIAEFMIQGGGFMEDGLQKETRAPIKLESNNGLSNLRGTIAMARTSAPDSATDQFFINVKDNLFLDHSSTNEGYAVFGKVIQGMDVVDKISNMQTTTKHGMADWPIEEVRIIEVYTG